MEALNFDKFDRSDHFDHMAGLPWDDPYCLHTAEEAISYINEIGFLPLFRGDIPGFSLEERTCPDRWWTDDEGDPWSWRETIARSGELAYGKFFGKRAGFVSKAWLPYFVNARRDGYDFDARWEDELATRRQKKIMDLFMEEENGAAQGGSAETAAKGTTAPVGGGDAAPNGQPILFSYEIKAAAGFGKDGEKGFEGTLTDLQMQFYLCVRDFEQKKNKKGQSYGWKVARYCTPEALFGRDLVTSAYTEEPAASRRRIHEHLMEIYPICSLAPYRKFVEKI